jgi:hypothetical protein
MSGAVEDFRLAAEARQGLAGKESRLVNRVVVGCSARSVRDTDTLWTS